MIRLFPRLDDTKFQCLHCLTEFGLGETLEEYFERRRGKKIMRPIELDQDGYSRKWPGINLSNGETIIRQDGKGHPSIICPICNKVNVFGLRGAGMGEQLMQVLGRSETDLRYLQERENGNHDGEGRRVVRQTRAPEAELARDVWPNRAEDQGGLPGEATGSGLHPDDPLGSCDGGGDGAGEAAEDVEGAGDRRLVQRPNRGQAGLAGQARLEGEGQAAPDGGRRETG